MKSDIVVIVIAWLTFAGMLLFASMGQAGAAIVFLMPPWMVIFFISPLIATILSIRLLVTSLKIKDTNPNSSAFGLIISSASLLIAFCILLVLL